MKSPLRQILPKTLTATAVLVGLAAIFTSPPAQAADPATDIQITSQQFTVNIAVGTANTSQQLIVNIIGNTAATWQQFIVNILDPSAVTLTVDKNTLKLSGPPGALMADHLTATVKTANSLGYQLTIEAVEPRLKCAASDDYILPLASAGEMTDNFWGWAYDSGLSPTTAPETLTWTGVASLSTTINNSATPTDLIYGDDIRIWIGTQVNFSLPACVYGGTSTLSATANL
jgi:hypothetical protein